MLLRKEQKYGDSNKPLARNSSQKDFLSELCFQECEKYEKHIEYLWGIPLLPNF
jgi:hypothetical protein